MINTDNKVGIPRLEWSERKNYNPYIRVSSVDLLCLKQLQIMSLMPYTLERGMLLPKLSNLQLQTKVKMQTLPLKNSVSIHRGICLSVVIFQANICYKNQRMINITRAVCFTVWFKIIVLAKRQSSLSYLAAIVVWKVNLCCPLPTNQPTEVDNREQTVLYKTVPEKSATFPHPSLSFWFSAFVIWSALV